MLRKILLPMIFGVLTYGFWISPDFKEIAAGVAIFLFGMLSLEEGFRAFTGGMLESLLRVCTSSRWRSLGFGILTTTVMQSSSLVSIITISFLSAGLIDLAAGIGIVFGANLGTTTGAWLVAGFGLKVNIAAFAMPMLVFGIILVFQKSKSLSGAGYVLAGLGFLFLGIHHMKLGFESFKEAFDLAAYAVPGLAGLLLFALIGILATVVMQSSHATLVLIITALAAEQITYDNALALAVGANVGTTVTAILGAMSANTEGRRLAAAHFVFNVATGLIALVAMSVLVRAVDSISAGLGIAATDYTLKLAVFHSLFNLIGLIVMLPFTDRLVALLQRWFVAPEGDRVEPKFLNEAVMSFPEAVFRSLHLESLHLYDNALPLLCQAIGLRPQHLHPEAELERVAPPDPAINADYIEDVYDRRVKELYGEILAFTSRAGSRMPDNLAEPLFQQRAAVRNLIQALKDAKHLNGNLNFYLRAENSHIRRQYVLLRAHLGEVLRQVNQVRGGSGETPGLELDPLRLKIEQYHQGLNAEIDGLIRDSRINATMAGSLMNDAGYAYDVASNLVAMAEVLFRENPADPESVEQDMALDAGEIERMARDG